MSLKTTYETVCDKCGASCFVEKFETQQTVGFEEVQQKPAVTHKEYRVYLGRRCMLDLCGKCQTPMIDALRALHEGWGK